MRGIFFSLLVEILHFAYAAFRMTVMSFRVKPVGWRGIPNYYCRRFFDTLRLRMTYVLARDSDNRKEEEWQRGSSLLSFQKNRRNPGKIGWYKKRRFIVKTSFSILPFFRVIKIGNASMLLFIFIPHFIPLVFPVFSVFLCNERLLFGRESQTFGSKIDPDKPYFFTKMRLGVIPEIAAPPIPFFILEKSRAAPAGYRLVALPIWAVNIIGDT